MPDEHKPIAAAVERTVKRARAEAWDEGYATAAQHSAAGHLGSKDPGNPYRGDEMADAEMWSILKRTIRPDA